MNYLDPILRGVWLYCSAFDGQNFRFGFGCEDASILPDTGLL